MLKISPQKCLEDFLEGINISRNYKFLIPIYEKLFKDIGEKINITQDYKRKIKVLSKYFLYIERLKNNNSIRFGHKNPNRKEIIDRFIKLIDRGELEKAILALEEIIDFLCKNRTNINGLEIISWSLFGKTTLKDIEKYYVNDKKKRNNIQNVLIGTEFMGLLIEYKGFSKIIVNDLLMPVELKSPKRRQGFFDKEVFKLISSEIKNKIKNFQFEDKIKKIDINFLKNNTNWLVTEKTTKKIEFPLPKNAKKIDMLCKVDNVLFVGSHKEQQDDGGAQDNQAVDAGFLFNYKRSELKKIMKIFNVKEVFLCIFLERDQNKIASSHWKNIFKEINTKNNNSKYLLSSVQFIDLVAAELQP